MDGFQRSSGGANNGRLRRLKKEGEEAVLGLCMNGWSGRCQSFAIKQSTGGEGVLS